MCCQGKARNPAAKPWGRALPRACEKGHGTPCVRRAGSCGTRPFSLTFSAKLQSEHWTFTVDQYTITSCVRDPDRDCPTPLGHILRDVSRTGLCQPWGPSPGRHIFFHAHPMPFRSPSAHTLCFPRLFRVHPARRRQGPIWRVYLQGITRLDSG